MEESRRIEHDLGTLFAWCKRKLSAATTRACLLADEFDSQPAVGVRHQYPNLCGDAISHRYLGNRGNVSEAAASLGAQRSCDRFDSLSRHFTDRRNLSAIDGQ